MSLNVTGRSLNADVLALLTPAQGYSVTQADYTGSLSRPPHLQVALCHLYLR